MQLKMTEREFFRKVEEACGTGWSRSIADLIAPIVHEAGVEFAPEPVKLPATIEITANGEYITCRHPDGQLVYLAIIGKEGRWDHCFANEPLLQEAWPEIVARNNNYPGLRSAAERLQSVLGGMLAAGSGYLGELHAAYRLLRGELAKGPK